MIADGAISPCDKFRSTNCNGFQFAIQKKNDLNTIIANLSYTSLDKQAKFINGTFLTKKLSPLIFM